MVRRVILIALTLLFVWLVAAHLPELRQLEGALAEASWGWALAAVAAQLAYYLVFTGSFQAAFYTVEISTGLLELLPVVLGSLFVNVAVPAGGAGGAALFTENLSRRGKPAARAAAGVLLQIIADYSAFTLLLIPGLAFLFLRHDLQIYEVVAALILLGFMLGLSGVLLLGLWNPDALRRLLGAVQRVAVGLLRRFKRDFSLGDGWAERNAAEFNGAAAAVAAHPGRLALAVLAALGAHLLDVLTLYLLFRGFSQAISLGALVAGFAVGVLFWVVSITPQGIGMVEGMMTLAYTSLGVPAAVAAAVTLAFRGLTFWIPMLLGFFAVRSTLSFQPRRRSLADAWGVRLTALLVAAMGVVNVLSAVTPSLAERRHILEEVSPLLVRRGGHLTAALAGFALLLLAQGLWRRKRVAWLLTLAVLVVSAISHLVKGLDYEEALLAAGLALLLWVMRHHFHARSDPPSIRQGLIVLIGASLFTLAYGMLGFYLLDRHFKVHYGWLDALRQTVVMFTAFYDPGLEPLTRFGHFFSNSIYAVGAATFGFAAWSLLRPVLRRGQPATEAERLTAQRILEQHACSSLARLALLDDKSYFFTPGGSLVTYSLSGRTAVTLGDPVGPREDLPAAIEGFKALCARNDWIPCFYETMPETLDLYRAAGFEAVCVGDEGIVNLETFTLEGGAAKGMRSAVNRLTRLGHKFEVHPPPVSDELLEELRQISDEWLTNMHGGEKRFSLGWFDDDYVRSTPIAAVVTPEGWISAFANITTEYCPDEITIDLMRRRGQVENGTMEYLFVGLFQWAKAQGYRRFNLGLSSLAGVGESPQDPSLERLLHFIYENINQFYNFKGLHAFKAKFQPEWSPRYLIYPDKAAMAGCWMAVVRLNSGPENLLSGYLRPAKRLGAGKPA